MNLTEEQIRQRLKVEHDKENAMNRELKKLDNIIAGAKKKKLKIAKKISSNMKYRNKLINEIMSRSRIHAVLPNGKLSQS